VLRYAGSDAVILSEFLTGRIFDTPCFNDFSTQILIMANTEMDNNKDLNNTVEAGSGEEIKEQELNKKSDHSYDHKEKSKSSKFKKEDKIEKLELDLVNANDKFLRLYSEFDNYRKRTIKEKIELGKTAASEIITSILPVLDDFERAIKAFEISPESTDSLKHGIILIFNKFVNTLSQQGLQPLKTIGEEFNTDFHEAITNVPVKEPEQKGKVIDEIEKGYTLNGKVIRYAKVVVGS
jgi:molecular chaperone GrpE